LAPANPIKASLFVTCIIDQLYPQVGVSVVRVLRRLGVEVDFPMDQTCCGQPLFNAGYASEARKLARRVLASFQHSQYIVVPSGSCAAMLKVYLPELFAHDAALSVQSRELAAKVFEFSQFLAEVLKVSDAGGDRQCRAAYHPSCHLLRELGVREAPQKLLRQVSGLELVDLPQAETCCGFGGAFAVRYPHISEKMLGDKLDNLKAAGADTLVACDMGCLMHIGGGSDRQRLGIKMRHLAQILDPEAE